MQLYNGDCLEVLRGLPDNCIDLVVTDPPYNMESNGGGCFGKDGYFRDIDDMVNGYNPEILGELDRVMKATNIYIFCSKNEIPDYFDFYIKEKQCNYDLLTWHKTNVLPAANNTYMSDTEYLLFFRSPGVKVGGTVETKKKWYVTQTNRADKERYGHPTIKPLEIIENLVINSSIRGGVCTRPVYGKRYNRGGL